MGCPASTTELERRSDRHDRRHRHGPRRRGRRRPPAERGLDLAPTTPELVLLCVPDGGDRGGRGGDRPGPWVAHVSGATPLAALAPHERRFGVHPLQTFTRARGPEQLDGAWAAVTGETDEARATRLVARRDARPAAVRARRRGAHALPRRRRVRVQLPRHAPPRGGAALRERRRAARGARAAHAAHDRERLRADRPDRARRLGDGRSAPRRDPRASARARASSTRRSPARRWRSRHEGRAHDRRARGSTARSGSCRRWARSTTATCRCSRPRARRATSSSRRCSSTRRSSTSRPDLAALSARRGARRRDRRAGGRRRPVRAAAEEMYPAGFATWVEAGGDAGPRAQRGRATSAASRPSA